MKCTLLVCALAAFCGCRTTTYNDRDAQGTATPDTDTYRGSRSSSDTLIEGPNRGVNTNYFGPVNAGTEAARGPGTPSGNYDHIGR
ncbi:MAG TPA: hypothetical protein VK850_02605 [Candidatus Binatia bacterium]|nr:hypothetical protein [Candidatus Binatia bacterium]